MANVVPMPVSVLAFGIDVLRERKLLDAALSRISASAQTSALAIFCPTPMVLAKHLQRMGMQPVIACADPGLVRDVLRVANVCIIEGGQRDAIALAAELDAGQPIFYVPEAMGVEFAGHVELMELAEAGASPVSDDAAREAAVAGMNYELRSVTGDSKTIIRSDGYENRANPITSISVASGYTLVALRRTGGDAQVWGTVQMRVLERISRAGISIEMMQSSATGARFLISSRHAEAVRSIAGDFQLPFEAYDSCAKICVVGSGVRSTAGLFFRSLSALGQRNITVLHWGDSNVTLSFVVKESMAALSEQTLHDALAPGIDVNSGGALSFDADLGIVRVNGREARLGSRQRQLLRYLLDNIGRIIEAEELARHLFGSDGKEELAAVRVHLHNIRKKIEDDPDVPRFIVTVPEKGYVFVR